MCVRLRLCKIPIDFELSRKFSYIKGFSTVGRGRGQIELRTDFSTVNLFVCGHAVKMENHLSTYTHIHVRVCVCVCGGGHELESGCALQTNRSRAVQIKAAIPLDFRGTYFRSVCHPHICAPAGSGFGPTAASTSTTRELGGEQYPKQEVG